MKWKYLDHVSLLCAHLFLPIVYNSPVLVLVVVVAVMDDDKDEDDDALVLLLLDAI